MNETTLAVLKNFANINPNLVFDGSGIIRTVSESKALMAQAELETHPDRELGIYDLSMFLSTLSLIDEPKIDFSSKYMTISDQSGRSSLKYFYADVDLLTTVRKTITMPEVLVEFTLDEKTLGQIKHAASALKQRTLSITPADGALDLTVFEEDNKTSNTFTITVPGKYTKDNFKFVVLIDNLKLISGTYDVELGDKFISHFTKQGTPNLQYWIALEKSSEH